MVNFIIECVHEKLKQHKCNICQTSYGVKGTLNEQACSNGQWKQEAIQMWSVWVFGFQSHKLTKPHWMCQWKAQITSVQHLSKEFWPYSKSEETCSNCTWKQEAIQM